MATELGSIAASAPSTLAVGLQVTDAIAQRYNQQEARIKELQRELSEAGDFGLESLNAGYEQCLNDLQNIAHGVMEVVWAAGPAEGLALLLQRLEAKEIPVNSAMGVPHDWLSRWEVKLR